MTNPEGSSVSSDDNPDPSQPESKLKLNEFPLVTGDEQDKREIDKIQLTPEQRRRTFNTQVAARLALSLWLILGGVIVAHLGSVIWINVISTQPPEEIELRTANIDDSAKTIYTFLGTLVTAVSGYYFTTLTRSDNGENE